MQTPQPPPTGQPAYPPPASPPPTGYAAYPPFDAPPPTGQPITPGYTPSPAPNYGYYPPPYPPPPSYAPQLSTKAIVSLGCGIGSWVIVPFIGAIIAVIMGHMARGEIQRSQGAMTGDGFAIAGLVLGYINLIVSILGIAFIILLALAFASDGYRTY